MDLAGLHELLRSALIPRLQLPDVQALRCTSTSLRTVIDKLTDSAWTKIAGYKPLVKGMLLLGRLPACPFT